MVPLIFTLFRGRTHMRAWRWCVVAALVVWSDLTFGQASCSTLAGSFDITPRATIPVARDTPNGTVLWVGPNQNAYDAWSCNLWGSSNQFNVGSAIYSQFGITSSGYTTNVITGGGSYTVVTTSVPGVGVAVGGTGYTPIIGWFPWRDASVSDGLYSVVGPYTTPAGGAKVVFGPAFQMAIVKIGDINGGTLPAQIAAIVKSRCSYYPWGNCGPGNNDVNYKMTAVTFIQTACTTPDVTVALGKHSSTEFTGPGSTTSAVSFNINVNACPAGMNSVKYRVDPSTTVVDQSRSVVALDKSSSATGVGIQLLKSDGTTALPLATLTATTGYNATSGGNFQIPLKARYYQTGASVGPGPANTTMTFTMSYQ